MTDSDFLLVFPHIPKTGGTTLLFHFLEHLGPERVASYGPFARISRFFGDEFQWEEMGKEALRRLRVVMGHGVRQNLLQLMPHQDIRFLVVLREPAAHVRSRYTHAEKAQTLRGGTLSSREFWQHTETDMIARFLVARFPAFADAQAADLAAQARSVLTKFDYVCATDRLDHQIEALAALLGVPAQLKRERVARDQKDLPVSAAEIAAANPVDAALHEQASSPSVAGPGAHPFGFDPGGQAAAIAKVRARTPGTDDIQLRGYRQLAGWLCHELRAEAALEKLRTADTVALRSPERFTAMLEAAWAETKAGLDDRQRALSARALASFREGRLDPR